MGRHERRIRRQNMDFKVRTSRDEIRSDIGEFPGGEVVRFELRVDAHVPGGSVVVEAGEVEDAGLGAGVGGFRGGDGSVAEVDGVGLFARVGEPEVRDGEGFAGGGDLDEAGEDGIFVDGFEGERGRRE